jgi:hypothetical protein
LPCPSTNQALEAINSWLWLCKGLGVSPGNNTNLTAVDWSKTCIFTNPWIAPTAVVCRVTYTNGDRLDSIGGIACNYFASDACYANDWNTRSPEEWFLFEGKINHPWDNLVVNLERDLLEELRLPKGILAAYGAQLRSTGSPQLGVTGLKRVLVHWTNGLPQKVEYRDSAAWAWENHLGFSVEFDVESGELKSIRFRDPKLIEALGRAQSKAGRN